uniref:Uncharacterized protein n=1 Tax=Oryza punctata TaxID=4537 RepID=A0A0E0L5D7_ORYPU
MVGRGDGVRGASGGGGRHGVRPVAEGDRRLGSGEAVVMMRATGGSGGNSSPLIEGRMALSATIRVERNGFDDPVGEAVMLLGSVEGSVEAALQGGLLLARRLTVGHWSVVVRRRASNDGAINVPPIYMGRTSAAIPFQPNISRLHVGGNSVPAWAVRASSSPKFGGDERLYYV